MRVVHVVFVAALSLMICRAGDAAPSVKIGSIGLLPDTPGQVAQVYISGDQLVEAANLYLQVGGGAAGPEITQVDMSTGTIFDGSLWLQTDLGSVSNWQVAWGAVTTEGNPAAASGILANLTIDTTGLAWGVWPLRIDVGDFGITDLADVPANLWNGYLAIGNPFGDINGDGTVDAADIDDLWANQGPGAGQPYDLNNDGTADQLDVFLLVEDILNTSMGDVTLDGAVNESDLAWLADGWKLTPPGGYTWATGDLTGDGLINEADLAYLADNWKLIGNPDYSVPVGGAATVPEPCLLGAFAGLVLLRRRSR
jgi:hypothetical protein